MVFNELIQGNAPSWSSQKNKVELIKDSCCCHLQNTFCTQFVAKVTTHKYFQVRIQIMTKLSVIAAASALVLASSAAFAAQAPAGFANAGNPAAPAGFGAPSAPTNTIAQLLQNGMDEQRVSVTGRLTNFLGGENYEFSDDTGRILIQLDDDRNWGHLQKGALITIFGELDREYNNVKIDVDDAILAK